MANANENATPAAAVTSDPYVMGGPPVVGGTRVPAAAIIACLRAGRSHYDIFDDYPSLPVDGVKAVMAWAEPTMGPDWTRISAAQAANRLTDD